ncbi:hypothetical protein B0H11DRAFT_1807685 [Mycena galericulata]|nr:hypothetical protein B0H11DRAFT_1807685 [Mycena galericulata]
MLLNSPTVALIAPRTNPVLTREAHHLRTTFPSTLTNFSEKTGAPMKLRVIMQNSTPPRSDDPAEASSESSSFSSSDGRPTVDISPTRVRCVRPPHESTPTPMPTLSTGRCPVHVPAAGATSHLLPLPLPKAAETPRMAYETSCKPFKSPKSVMRARGSKSAPSTPRHGSRSVHFDRRLGRMTSCLGERKQFSAGRDRLPTEDVIGTDGDFPDLIAYVLPLPGEVNAKLKSLVLSDDGKSLAGTVSVSKLAFGKWVAVWFTFDDWQTKREVTTRYGSAITRHSGGITTRYDRRVGVFTFSIRLDDFLSVTSVMMLAVKYNNGGGSYRVTFRRVQAKATDPEGEVDAESSLLAKKTHFLEEDVDSNVHDAVDQDWVEDVFA